MREAPECRYAREVLPHHGPSANWPAPRSVSPKTAKPALRGSPPRSSPAVRRSARLPPLVGGPPPGGTRSSLHRRHAAPTRSSQSLLGVEPACRLTCRGAPPSGHGLPAQGGGHRARRRALATSGAGFALSDSARFVRQHRAYSGDRGSSLATSRPITRAARREWRSPRCRGGRAAKIAARAAVVRLGPFHGRRLDERRRRGVLDPGLAAAHGALASAIPWRRLGE